MPNQHPLLGKNLLLLLCKNFRRNEIALAQGLGASRECLSRLAKFWRYVGLHRWHLRMLHAGYVRVNALIPRVLHADLGALAKTNLLRVNAGRVLPQDHLVKFVPIVKIV
jgi:hypothetical protein